MSWRRACSSPGVNNGATAPPGVTCRACETWHESLLLLTLGTELEDGSSIAAFRLARDAPARPCRLQAVARACCSVAWTGEGHGGGTRGRDTLVNPMPLRTRQMAPRVHTCVPSSALLSAQQGAPPRSTQAAWPCPRARVHGSLAPKLRPHGFVRVEPQASGEPLLRTPVSRGPPCSCPPTLHPAVQADSLQGPAVRCVAQELPEPGSPPAPPPLWGGAAPPEPLGVGPRLSSCGLWARIGSGGRALVSELRARLPRKPRKPRARPSGPREGATSGAGSRP